MWIDFSYLIVLEVNTATSINIMVGSVVKGTMFYRKRFLQEVQRVKKVNFVKYIIRKTIHFNIDI